MTSTQSSPAADQKLADQKLADQKPADHEPAADGRASEQSPPSGADPSGLDARLAAVEAALARLLAVAEDDAARAAARERVIDRQHAEIERLRAAERTGLLRPVVTDLYRLRNGLLRQAATTPAELSGERVRVLLESFADEVTEALERCGVVVVSGTTGAPPEAGRHQVTGLVPTTEPHLDGTIAAVVQDGYAEADGGRVVVPARIALYRFPGHGFGAQREGDADG